MLDLLAFLAQATTTPAAAPAKSADPLGGLGGLLLPLLFIGILYYVLLVLPRKKQDKERQTMLDTLKKGDRIQTIGGVLGTVISADASEVVVKIDETTNTKMKFVRTAINKVLVDDVKTAK